MHLKYVVYNIMFTLALSEYFKASLYGIMTEERVNCEIRIDEAEAIQIHG